MAVAPDRRSQLAAAAVAVASLATERGITPRHVRHVVHDLELRPILETVVRRWTLLERPKYATPGAMALPRREQHLEHVVPCRVLVDRMIMNPDECELLLTSGVVLALVTKDEHKRLGGIFTHHRLVYEQMLQAPVTELADLGAERYRSVGVPFLPI